MKPRRPARPPEQELQIAIMDAWRLLGRPDVIAHHSPNQYADTKAKGGIAKAMGMVTGWPDLIFLNWGKPYFVEVKTLNTDLSPSQAAFRQRCWELDIPHAVVRSVDEALSIWRTWGFLRRDVVEVPNARPAYSQPAQDRAAHPGFNRQAVGRRRD